MPVFIAAMNMRGKWADRPAGSVVLNVTSAQSKTSKERLAFSPMTPIEGGYKGFHCFENYWQAGKVIEGFDHAKAVAWWKAQTEGKRRYPKSKGANVLHSLFDDGIARDYITSRREIYVPEYSALIQENEVLEHWKRRAETETIVIYDFDGPRSETGEPLCMEVTLELLRDKIMDPRHPFGHGYIVAAKLVDIEPREFI